MGDEIKDPPPYIIPIKGTGPDDVVVYHTHTPFNPQASSNESASHAPQVYTNGGGLETGDGKQRFVSYDEGLGSNPGMTTCTSCQQQVMTNVTYKAGTYAWLMCLLFICCGCILCCCLIPFFVNKFKDAQHTCPRCSRVLHVHKKKCCK